MLTKTIQNGSQIANDLPDSAAICAHPQINLHLLSDLLTAIASTPDSQAPMLRSTAGKIAAFIGKPVDQISLDLINAKREGFRPFLESMNYKEASVRSYVNYMRILLNKAIELGWKPGPTLSAEWLEVLNIAKGKRSTKSLRCLAELADSPALVTEDLMEQLIQKRMSDGVRLTTVRSDVQVLWHTLASCGYTKNLPKGFFARYRYGVPFDKMPARLQEDITRLFDWKTAEFQPGRSNSMQIRKVSAKGTIKLLSRLLGFATKIAGFGEIQSLDELIRKDILEAFIAWFINERKKTGSSLGCTLGSILAALSQHPDYKTRDWEWFRVIMRSIPKEDYEEVKARKAKKYLPYDVLCAIPGEIHSLRTAAAKNGAPALARLVMEELMMSWLLVFPWRQRNIRECRVDGANPNLFKGKVPTFSTIDKPAWVLAEEAHNPDAEFWQVKFSRKETKTKVTVHVIVPKMLVSLLEEYVTVHRPILMNNQVHEELFINNAEVKTAGFVNRIVSDCTLRHGGRRVTPHIFRDIFAFAWLKEHPEDYLTLSKMLWHKDVATTINYYGSRFNESSATVAMEGWLTQHAQKAKGN